MAAAQEADRLVIFDCDGVLVDSEPIALEELVAALNAAGAPIGSIEASERFLGRSLGAVIADVRVDYGLAIDEAFLAAMRSRLYQRFRAELTPIPGVAAALDRLIEAGIPRCVASSSQQERIELCLTVTGLIDRFPRLFSATMVARGKPAPDLFLHAASQMGVAPENCIVVEDSPAGVAAGKAAGMTVFAFTGGSHATGEAYHGALAERCPDETFDAMADLFQLVKKRMNRDGSRP